MAFYVFKKYKKKVKQGNFVHFRLAKSIKQRERNGKIKINDISCTRFFHAIHTTSKWYYQKAIFSRKIMCKYKFYIHVSSLYGVGFF